MKKPNILELITAYSDKLNNDLVDYLTSYPDFTDDKASEIAAIVQDVLINQVSKHLNTGDTKHA